MLSSIYLPISVVISSHLSKKNFLFGYFCNESPSYNDYAFFVKDLSKNARFLVFYRDIDCTRCHFSTRYGVTYLCKILIIFTEDFYYFNNELRKKVK